MCMFCIAQRKIAHHKTFIYRTRAIISHFWIQAIHKDRIFWKNLLKNKEMVFWNGVKNIQAVAYKGARKVNADHKKSTTFHSSRTPWLPFTIYKNFNWLSRAKLLQLQMIYWRIEVKKEAKILCMLILQ